MMLPTDLALKTDPGFLPHVEKYAKSQDEFFKDFSVAFAKLIALGCPDEAKVESTEESDASRAFREMAMHGNLIRMKEIEGSPDPNAPEVFTNRTALHKASYFGHDHVVEYVLGCGGNVSATDVEGDTPLHDAVRLGHVKCTELLLNAGAKSNVKNNKGETPLSLAKAMESQGCIDAINKKKGLLGMCV